MKYQIVELIEFSGKVAAIYSILPEGSETTLFDDFLNRYKDTHREGLKNIEGRITMISDETGARSIFFKENEGKPGDGVCALYDNPDHQLRLYCIRYGSGIVILGDGGPKPPGVRAWQDDEALSRPAEQMIEISRQITERIKEGDISHGPDGSYLEGDLDFDDEVENGEMQD